MLDFHVSGAAERVLQDKGLLMRPILYFNRLDQFHNAEERLALELQRLPISLAGAALGRVARSYAFADVLSREVLRSFYPALRDDGDRCHRILWAAAVLLDHILDEGEEDPSLLGPIREWVATLIDCTVPIEGAGLRTTNNEINTLVYLLETLYTDWRHRSRQPLEYERLHLDLVRILDAELASPRLSLQMFPDKRVRETVRDKSVLLCWVGFCSSILGHSVEPAQMAEYRKLCDAIGEILWIMDDLADIEEDLDQGVWNRALWELYDCIGENSFRQAIHCQKRLVQALCKEHIIERGVLELARRLEFLKSHSAVNDPSRVESMLAFWTASWMRIYA